MRLSVSSEHTGSVEWVGGLSMSSEHKGVSGVGVWQGDKM